jgi:hypothetical protein
MPGIAKSILMRGEQGDQIRHIKPYLTSLNPIERVVREQDTLSLVILRAAKDLIGLADYSR